MPNSPDLTTPGVGAQSKQTAIERFELTAIGRTSTFFVDGLTSRPKPLGQDLLTDLTQAGVYLPDVMHRWGLPTASCDARAAEWGGVSYFTVWDYPDYCAGPDQTGRLPF
jgi:hypothetical protein